MIQLKIIITQWKFATLILYNFPSSEFYATKYYT